MTTGRPRTAIGTYGAINVRRKGAGRRYVAETRFRDLDGRLRQVKATGSSRSAAVVLLKDRLLNRPGYGGGGVLNLSSPFTDLAELWLADLELRHISEGTKENYRDDLRVHVRPYFEHYALGEITTGRVETFLKAQAAVSYSRAKHSRTLLNQLFGYALRHDALARNPVEGTSPLHKPRGTPQALTIEQMAAIRAAAAAWRTAAGRRGPKPDDKVRDLIEVLAGTSMRPGEALALRPCDIEDGKRGMVAHVRGTAVYRQGRGTFRQDHPKTGASVRTVPVPEFAAVVLRRRLAEMTLQQSELTIFANKNGGVLSQHNVRRTFREFLVIAGLANYGITPRWYRRTGATVLARGLGVDAAAMHLGHTSKAITEAHYIEPDRTIDFGPATVLELTLRPNDPDGTLLARPETDEEGILLDRIDPREDDSDQVA
jgi:integrase